MSGRRGPVELFVLLYGFWLLLSWRLDPLFLALGAVLAVGVTLLTRDLVSRETGWVPVPALKVPLVGARAVAYGVWMLTRIIRASTQVAYFVLHPRMPLEPATVRFRVALRSPVARTMLAHSITLIPGTMTVELDQGECEVHALVPSAVDDLVSGRMQNKIAGLFLDEDQPPVVPVWDPPRGDAR